MAIACAGYRVVGWTPRISFDVVRLAIRKAAERYSDYFDRCRQKRKVIDYDEAFVASETEAKEIVTQAKEFVAVVEQCTAKYHSSLKAQVPLLRGAGTPGRNGGLIRDWRLNWGLRCARYSDSRRRRCRPCACKLFRINFPLNS